MKFSDMTYTRPDLEAAKAAISAHTDALKGAESYEEARAAFLKMQELHSHLYTADTLAYVRHTIDTRDAYYDEEARFLAEQRGEAAYRAAAEGCQDPCLRALYLELAQEEQGHSLALRSILEEL